MSRNVLQSSGQSKHSKDNRDILSHWVWAVPILLVAAALAIRQIDLYPPNNDEFRSMYNSGWLVGGPFSPIDIVQSLQRHSPDHTAGYFMLLSLWGNLTTYDIALARVFTIFTGLLSLAIVYRLARDLVAPLAGLLALIVVSSSAFYNFYIPYARMYPLLVFLSGIVLWLYLRITYQLRHVKRRDYVTLSIVVFALVNTHVFGATFLLMLGGYHLLVAPKNQRWFWVSVAVVVALLLFSPYLLVLRSGIERIFETRARQSNIGSWVAIHTWLTLVLNNQAGLLLLSIIGLALGIWKKKFILKPYLIMVVLYLLALALLAEFTIFVRMPDMRYHLVSWLPFVLFIVAGLYALYCFRRWLGLLVLLWVIAGLVFQGTANWSHYIGSIRVHFFLLPPAQLISRLASQTTQKPSVIGYLYPSFALNMIDNINYLKRDYYSKQYNITFKNPDHLEKFEEDARQSTPTSPSLWVFYQTSKTEPDEITEIDAIMDDLHYQLCDTLEVGMDTVILQYAWNTLDCSPPQLLASHQTDIINYQFYGAELDTANSTIMFNDQWTPRVDDALENYKMSYQLITPDWNNVAQLDLPLVHPGQLRLFSIDTADVPAGTYRLMAILYDGDSGERQDWLNNAQDVSNMLTLTEMVIP